MFTYEYSMKHPVGSQIGRLVQLMWGEFGSKDFFHRGNSNVNTSHVLTSPLQVLFSNICLQHLSTTIFSSTCLQHSSTPLLLPFFYNTSPQQSSPTLPTLFPNTSLSLLRFRHVPTTLLHSTTLFSNTSLQHSSPTLLYSNLAQHFYTKLPFTTLNKLRTLPQHFPRHCSTTLLYKNFSDPCLQHFCTKVFSKLLPNIFPHHLSTTLFSNTFPQHYNTLPQHVSTTLFYNTSLQFYHLHHFSTTLLCLYNTFLQEPFSTPLLYNTLLQRLPTILLFNTLL